MVPLHKARRSRPMPRTPFRPLFTHARFCAAVALVLLSAMTLSLAGEADDDRGLAMRIPSFSAEDEKVVRGWFKELGSEDFEARDAAVSKIIEKGPAVLAIAK